MLFDPSCKLKFLHAIPIIFTEEVSQLLIEFKQEQEQATWLHITSKLPHNSSTRPGQSEESTVNLNLN
jgi:hypothetical protein